MTDTMWVALISAIVAICVCGFVTLWIFKIHNMRLKLSGFGLAIELDGIVKDEGEGGSLIIATQHGELHSQPMRLIADRRQTSRSGHSGVERRKK